MMKTGSVYVLLCSDKTLYTGVTSDLDERMYQHHEALFPGYTHSRRPLTLLWISEELDIQDALILEKQLKGWSRAKKLAFISGDIPRLIELSLAYRDRSIGGALSLPFESLRETNYGATGISETGGSVI